MSIFQDLNISWLLPKNAFFGWVSDFSLKSSKGKNRCPRQPETAVSQFHGVPCKKLLGLSPQTQMSTMSGTLKSSKTCFGEFHYVEF